jgi:hypothetical protein
VSRSSAARAKRVAGVVVEGHVRDIDEARRLSDLRARAHGARGAPPDRRTGDGRARDHRRLGAPAGQVLGGDYEQMLRS